MPTAPQKQMTLEQAIAFARQTHKAGKTENAQGILLQILNKHPQSVPAMRALGDISFDLKRFAEAAQIYGRAAGLSPKDFHLHLVHGNALQSSGRFEDAIKAFRNVLTLKPNHPIALNNIGNAFQSLKQFDNASKAYLQSLKSFPRQSLANYNLGVLMLKLNKPARAIEYLRAALRIEAKHVLAMHNLGVAFHRTGKRKEAEAAYRRAIKLRANYGPAFESLGALLAESGRLPDAAVTLRSAVQFNPKSAQSHMLLGNVLRAVGKTDEGVTQLKQAVRLAPRYADARVSLANALIQQDKQGDAASLVFAGLTQDVNNVPLRRTGVSLLREMNITQMNPAGRRILLSMLNDASISAQDLARVVNSLVRGAAYFRPLLDAADKGGDILSVDLAAARSMMADSLLLTALPKMVLCDPDIEKILTALRRSFLLRAAASPYPFQGPEGVSGPFLASLARQSFSAEYSFYVQGDEQEKIDALKTQIESSLAAGDFSPNAIEWPLGVYALYAPINSLAKWENILGTSLASWSQHLASIIREQVFEKVREAEFARAIPTITPIQDATTKKFLKLYDANPYPRWRSVSFPEPETIEGFAKRLRPGEAAPTLPKPAPVLVAGCGTGHHPIQVALRFPQAQVTALDISAVTLGYGARMAERFNVGSILWRRGDILELGSTETKYAVIECGGVLHHVKDPAAAIEILRDRLLPGGLMKLAFYSTSARALIEPARAFVKQHGFDDTPEGIREARKAILALPADRPEREVVTSSDFFSCSGCRFLAYPVAEHTFTLPELAGMLEKLNLRFLSWDLPHRAFVKFREANPEPGAFTDLAAWTRFEATDPLVFRKMYQFWVGAK